MRVLQGFVCAILVAFSSCNRPEMCDPAEDSRTARRFAYQLYAQTVAESDSESNLFLAPTTVANALAMVLAGANGATKDQILHGLMSGNVSQNFDEDRLSCLLRTNEDDGADAGDGNLVLKTAARIFGEKTYMFARSFLLRTKNFGARMKKVNFVGNPAAARNRINGWVARQTENKIQDLFPEDDIDSRTILAIVSAIYFKGLWESPFEERYTRPSEFHVTESKSVSADFMYKSGKFKSTYSTNLNAELLELPYQGSATDNASMIIVLPQASVSGIEQKLTDEQLAPEIAKLFSSNPYKLEVFLPKFKISAQYDLKPILERMGITNMFSPGISDLSGMRSPKSRDTRPLYVSSAVHKTFIEVDEKGTEAAGATGFGIEALSLPPQILCNRPFLTIIYEKQSGGILFIGKVNDPTAE